jgi:hypothetical protein
MRSTPGGGYAIKDCRLAEAPESVSGGPESCAKT